jgi:hypothetical protein
MLEHIIEKPLIHPSMKDAEEENWSHINNITKNYIQIKDRVLESKKYALRCHNPWLSSNRLQKEQKGEVSIDRTNKNKKI